MKYRKSQRRRSFILSCVTSSNSIIVATNSGHFQNIKVLSKTKQLVCPICKQEVYFKCGKKNIPHFAHLSKCTYSGDHEPETIEHMTGKQFLYNKLIRYGRCKNVQLEKYFPEYSFRPDIYFEFDGGKYAIEYQCYPIQECDYALRTMKYLKAGFTVIWIFGSNKQPFSMLKRVLIGIHQINVQSELFAFSSKLMPNVSNTFQEISTIICRATSFLVSEEKFLLKYYCKKIKDGEIKSLTNRSDFNKELYERIRRYINMDARKPVRVSIDVNGDRFFQALSKMTYDKCYHLNVIDIYEAIKIKFFLVYLNFGNVQIDKPNEWILYRGAID